VLEKLQVVSWTHFFVLTLIHYCDAGSLGRDSSEARA
jgi:hypothetical protein